MYETIHLKPQDELVSMFRRTHGYNGPKFKLAIHDSPGMDLSSYWSGGSREYHTIVKLATLETISVPENGSGFVADVPGEISKSVPSPGFAVVTHGIFCGKDMGITIHIHRENAAKLIQNAPEISDAEKVVLSATRSLKSSYAGISNYRLHSAKEETGITEAQWNEAKTALIARGLLNRAGAITVDGKNAIGQTRLESLKLNGSN